jgi:hypothetical protein
MSKLSFTIALFLSFCPFFFSLPAALVALLLTLNFGFLSFSLYLLSLFPSDSGLFFNDCCLFLTQLLTDSLALRLPSFSLGSVFLVCFRASSLLGLGGFFADVTAADRPNAFLDCSNVNQLANDCFGLLVDAGALQCAVN